MWPPHMWLQPQQRSDVLPPPPLPPPLLPPQQPPQPQQPQQPLGAGSHSFAPAAAPSSSSSLQITTVPSGMTSQLMQLLSAGVSSGLLDAINRTKKMYNPEEPDARDAEEDVGAKEYDPYDYVYDEEPQGPEDPDAPEGPEGTEGPAGEGAALDPVFEQV
jgi:hypothetical protein